MKKQKQRSVKAICKRASQLAPGATVEELVQLADAVAKVTFGPQGASTDYRYEADILNQHGSRPRGEAGFR